MEHRVVGSASHDHDGLQTVGDDLTDLQQRERDDLGPKAQDELLQLKTTLKNKMQNNRMQQHVFEPVSLPGSQPVSRVPSGSATPSKRHSLRPSPPPTGVQSPPLTPAGSRSHSGNLVSYKRHVADSVTPQKSPSGDGERKTTAKTTATSASQSRRSDAVASHPRQPPVFSVGPRGDSQPPSKEHSRTGTPVSTAPGTPTPYTPSETVGEASRGEASRGKRPPPHVLPPVGSDAQFRFGSRDPSIGFASSAPASVSVPGGLPGTENLPQTPRASTPTTTVPPPDPVPSKRSSIFGGAKKDHEDSFLKPSERESSKVNLKRFFKIGEHKHHRNKSKHQPDSPKEGGAGGGGGRPALRTDVFGSGMPFADDHGIQSKYGKFGKVLGSGAGGSVRLMRRAGDGTVFAVKQFRDRHSYESEKDYNKKVTSEFCIGSTLHHGNIIETIDIVYERGKWYEVMEFAPYDLFATVMMGKMSRPEVTCATLQILSGVLYLHSMGLAHRDLKLDNVVVSEQGIMKLIDFGSATVFRYPFEKETVFATGIVGSDPYLAPEVYERERYDASAADIWSIAIIFCCMSLRRFPWKAPRPSDNSFRLFISPPDPEYDKSRRSPSKTPAVDTTSPAPANGTHAAADHHNPLDAATPSPSSPSASAGSIKGPFRLLRLLPRETRWVISRMLELDPSRRATMDEILADPWVQNALVCRQEEDGRAVLAPDHTHTLHGSLAGRA